MTEAIGLLTGTVLLRPYVFAFLLAYILASSSRIGWRRTLLFIPIGYALAWASEFISINWGFPYGDYFYIPSTVGRELWVFGVPFMDSLSYVFLAYCSFSSAIFLLSPLTYGPVGLHVLETHEIRRSGRTLVLGAILFVLLDIIIDPVALQGGRWFLGSIYGYRTQGIYFGIPMSNFAGWLLMGFILVGAAQLLDRIKTGAVARGPRREILAGLGGPCLYCSIIMFNLSVTFWIGEYLMGTTGLLIVFFTGSFAAFLSEFKIRHSGLNEIELHLADFPGSSSASLLPGRRSGQFTDIRHAHPGESVENSGQALSGEP